MTIELLLDMAADGFAGRGGLTSSSGTLTYTDLQRAVAGGARLIAQQEPGTVVFVGVNSEVLPALMFASARAGVPFASLNYRLTAEGLGELLDRLDNPLIVAADAYAPHLGPGRLTARAEDWIATALAAPRQDPQPVDDDSPAVLLFTSGTTSAPKCVVLSHTNLTSYVLESVEFGSADPSSAALVSVPPYHIAGIGAVLSNVYSGRRIVYLPNFTARAWLDLVAAEHVTHAMVVPTMLARLVREVDGAPASTPTLRHLAYGGAKTPRPVLEAALRAFPGVGFVNSYGLTETSSTIAVLGPEEHREFAASRDPAISARLESAGKLLPGVSGEIRDGDGVRLPHGEIGELWVRGEQVSGEYAGRGSALDEDGWFPTRDRARFDDAGYLFVLGRADDTIIRGGENIAPAEIEQVLVEHPDIDETAVLGIPDEEWGELVCAVVVPRAGSAAGATDPAALRGWARSRLRSSRTPDLFVLMRELPYSATGKLLRNTLREQVSAALPEPTREALAG